MAWLASEAPVDAKRPPTVNLTNLTIMKNPTIEINYIPLKHALGLYVVCIDVIGCIGVLLEKLSHWKSENVVHGKNNIHEAQYPK
jgi:hypothetical protein